MSDFFSGIYGMVQPPQVVMNRGPLPPTESSGMPPGFNGTPDAKIDYSSTLLGDMDPYAYGGPGRLSTQAAYLNIPHVAQRIIPQINIPEPQPSIRGGRFMSLNHQVDDGDVAFIVRAMFSPFDLVADKGKYNRQGILYAIDPVMNLASTNYILHGLQRYGFDRKEAKNWHSLWTAFKIDDYFKGLDGQNLSDTMQAIRTELNRLNALPRPTTDELNRRLTMMMELRYHRKRLAEYIIKSIITPFGIPRGSEKQGGQHQGVVNKSVTNPVDFVTALVIDGKAINLANLWRQDDISAGDDLVLYLEDRPYVEYVLSHHPKSRRVVQFEPLEKWEAPAGIVESNRVGNASSRAYRRMWDLMGDVQTKTYAPNPAGGAGFPLDRFVQPAPAAGGAQIRPPGGINVANTWNNGVDGQGANITMNEALVEISNATRVMDSLSFQRWCVRAQYAGGPIAVNNNRNPRNARVLQPAQRDRILSEMKRLVEEHTREKRKGVDARTSGSGVCLIDESIFQLVPGVSSSSSTGLQDAIWKEGFWHIARSQVMQFKYDRHADIPNGAVAGTSGKLLEVTFAPVWIEPLEADTMTGQSAPVAASFAWDSQDRSFIPHSKRLRAIPGSPWSHILAMGARVAEASAIAKTARLALEAISGVPNRSQIAQAIKCLQKAQMDFRNVTGINTEIAFGIATLNAAPSIRVVGSLAAEVAHPIENIPLKDQPGWRDAMQKAVNEVTAFFGTKGQGSLPPQYGLTYAILLARVHMLAANFAERKVVDTVLKNTIIPTLGNVEQSQQLTMPIGNNALAADYELDDHFAEEFFIRSAGTAAQATLCADPESNTWAHHDAVDSISQVVTINVPRNDPIVGAGAPPLELWIKKTTLTGMVIIPYSIAMFSANGLVRNPNLGLPDTSDATIRAAGNSIIMSCMPGVVSLGTITSDFARDILNNVGGGRVATPSVAYNAAFLGFDGIGVANYSGWIARDVANFLLENMSRYAQTRNDYSASSVFAATMAAHVYTAFMKTIFHATTPAGSAYPLLVASTATVQYRKPRSLRMRTQAARITAFYAFDVCMAKAVEGKQGFDLKFYLTLFAFLYVKTVNKYRVQSTAVGWNQNSVYNPLAPVEQKEAEVEAVQLTEWSVNNGFQRFGALNMQYENKVIEHIGTIRKDSPPEVFMEGFYAFARGFDSLSLIPGQLPAAYTMARPTAEGENVLEEVTTGGQMETVETELEAPAAATAAEVEAPRAVKKKKRVATSSAAAAASTQPASTEQQQTSPTPMASFIAQVGIPMSDGGSDTEMEAPAATQPPQQQQSKGNFKRIPPKQS